MISLYNHSKYSLLRALTSPSQIAEKTSKLGYKAAALTDLGNIAGCVEFYKECKKQNIKPILGSELYISQLDPSIKDNANGLRQMDHLVVLCKNLDGWKNLIQAISESNSEECFYYRPRLDLKRLSKYSKNLLIISGHLGTELGNAAQTKDEEYVCATIEKYKEMFGDNFSVEIQRTDGIACPEQIITSDILRSAAKKTNTRTVCTADSHYAEKTDAEDQRVLLCSAMQTTFKKVQAALVNNEEVGLDCFFKSESYHIPDFDFVKSLYTEEELANTMSVFDMCEDYNILSNPKLHKFNCPNGLSEIEYLKELCRAGWRNKINGKNIVKETYVDRLHSEFKVIEDAGLAGYFLIVEDYVSWCKKQGWLLSPGRGSVGGSLVAYLLNITDVDPIEFGLIFERFYNTGRNTKDNISLPDIDVDFPKYRRHEVVTYIKQKYGESKVKQIATFHSLKGRGALREVLRVHEACDLSTINLITKDIPEPASISDKLEESKDDSIIRWVLQNMPEVVKDYCQMDDSGNLTGEYARYFAQAIRIEGVYKSQSKHASGIVIANEDINTMCPIISSKEENETIAGFDMDSAEAVGCAKFDILGLNSLDKLMLVNDLLKDGVIHD